MKLELKHLSPYLPYGLKMICLNYWEGDDSPEAEWLLDSLSADDNYWWNEDGDNFTIGSDFKPILRPLSDLYNEIATDNVIHYPYATLKIPLDLAMNMDYENINNFPHRVITQMIKWHFDVFGLIPKGLAIDINTLK